MRGGVTYQRVIPPKGFENGCPNLEIENAAAREQEIFSSGTWSSFRTRGRHWSFALHITPLVGQKRAGSAPHLAGRATVALLASVHFLTLSFGLVSPLSIKLT